MKITIYGVGYVGLVTGACFAELGHDVLCVDIDVEKITKLQQGVIPIYEPGLADIVDKNLRLQRLRFSTHAEEGVAHGIYQFICVNTPADAQGAADIHYVLTVTNTIATHMQAYRIIINKSTAPVGTVTKIQHVIQTHLDKHGKAIPFSVASNPEFLKEGAAVNDSLTPDRVIVGVADEQAKQHLCALYANFEQQNKLIVMDIASAELTKYAANAMLATKISFINSIANLADQVAADIQSIRKGLSVDPRIGPHFIAAGCSYGGSCFPKDVQALIHMASDKNVEPLLLSAVEATNQLQKHILTEKILTHFNGDVHGRTLAVWGLAFKPNTNDIREASSLVLLEDLWRLRVKVKAYDPIAMPEIQKYFGARDDLELCATKEDCVENADALIIVTEWQQFAEFDPQDIKAKMKYPILFDGRNMFTASQLHEWGFIYYGIGQR